ncbi:MAG TPA: hypothetical protein VL285_26355, partial [Bryobacteraceae bacterium]|nr:hypothetical protein [Bryobacteraceae bacterium]
MKLPTTLAAIAFSLAGATAFGQPQAAAILARAQADFLKVDSEPVPGLQSTMSCLQSNAAAVAVARAEDRYLWQYRKGYCGLFGALVNGSSETFQAAARDFTDTHTNWPKKTVTRPPAGLRALAMVARLEQGRMVDNHPDSQKEFEAIVNDPNCQPTPLMSTVFCNSLVDVSRVWLGWFAWRRNAYDQAAQALEKTPAAALSLWVRAKLAQDQKRPDEAASLYQKAVAASQQTGKSANPDLIALLGPKIETSVIQYQAGLLEYSRQRYDAAIGYFDSSLKASPSNSYAIFLRARSKEALRLNQPALADYVLAAQTARANNDTSWSVGQAFFQRGMLFYQMKDYVRAEGEFATAMTARLT